jgi:hypothetical protein
MKPRLRKAGDQWVAFTPGTTFGYYAKTPYVAHCRWLMAQRHGA